LARFVWRLLGHGAVAIAILAASLAIGMVGYATLEDLVWIDAFLNSAMLLSGMGPVNPPKTDAGKLFAGVYALYAGLVFLGMAALLITPVAHRVLHHFHWADDHGARGEP
jgi:hypothetical protein